MTKANLDTFFKVADTGGCIAVESERGTGCQTYRLQKLPNIVRRVESFWGTHERNCAWVDTKHGRVLAVKATGTLFKANGECLSSPNMRMIGGSDES
jgi:hypothetical protein